MPQQLKITDPDIHVGFIWDPGRCLWVHQLSVGAAPNSVLGAAYKLSSPAVAIGVAGRGSGGGLVHSSVPAQRPVLSVCSWSGSSWGGRAEAEMPAWSIGAFNGQHDWSIEGSWPAEALVWIQVRGPGGAGSIPGAYAVEWFLVEMEGE